MVPSDDAETTAYGQPMSHCIPHAYLSDYNYIARDHLPNLCGSVRTAGS